MNTNLGNVPNGPLMNMLQKLNDKDLAHVCQINKNFHSICKDDHFWKERAYQKIQEFQKLKDTYFPHETSYKKIYTAIRANKKTKYTYGSKTNGLYIEWYENGQIRERSNWKNNQLDGLSEFWYKNGQIGEISNWKNYQRDGLYEYWYKNGQIQERSNWKNGQKDGLYEFWYANGQIREISNWKNGQRENEQRLYFKNF